MRLVVTPTGLVAPELEEIAAKHGLSVEISVSAADGGKPDPTRVASFAAELEQRVGVAGSSTCKD